MAAPLRIHTDVPPPPPPPTRAQLVTDGRVTHGLQRKDEDEQKVGES